MKGFKNKVETFNKRFSIQKMKTEWDLTERLRKRFYQRKDRQRDRRKEVKR